MTLDTRQRAMLAEMGVRIWAPLADPPLASAGPARAVPARASAPAPSSGAQAVAAPAPRSLARPPVALPPATNPPASTAAAWRLDAPRPLFPTAPAQTGTGASIWLVALDSPTPDDPGAGEAGALLRNMLRAMGLENSPHVLVSTVRRSSSDAAQDPRAFEHALAALRPAVILALGQSAARGVLGGQEPLARLRLREHRLADATPVVVSYAPAYLLRAPKAKREAWADLQRAMALAAHAGPMP